MTGGWLQCLLSENTPMYIIIINKESSYIGASASEMYGATSLKQPKALERIDQPMLTLKCVTNPSTFLKGLMYGWKRKRLLNKKPSLFP